MWCTRLAVIALFGGCATECGELHVKVVETDVEPTHALRVGVGLGLDLGAWVSKGIPVGPKHLSVLADDETTLSLEYKVTALDAMGQPDETLCGYCNAVRATPSVPGSNRLVFLADNSDLTRTVEYEAVPVTSVRFVEKLASRATVPSEIAAFLGSTFSFDYEFTSGEQVVLGRLPVIVDAPLDLLPDYTESVSTGEPYFRFDYRQAHTVVMSIPLDDTSLTIHVVGADAIARITLDVDASVPLELESGASKRVIMTPHDAADRRIRGHSRDAPTGVVAGSSVTASVSSNSVYIRAVEPGRSLITLTWGSASAELTVDVTDPASP
jgi:hypothetical protein